MTITEGRKLKEKTQKVRIHKEKIRNLTLDNEKP